MKLKVIGICAICCAVAGTVAATCIMLSKAKRKNLASGDDCCAFDFMGEE